MKEDQHTLVSPGLSHLNNFTAILQRNIEELYFPFSLERVITRVPVRVSLCVVASLVVVRAADRRLPEENVERVPTQEI